MQNSQLELVISESEFFSLSSPKTKKKSDESSKTHWFNKPFFKSLFRTSMGRYRFGKEHLDLINWLDVVCQYCFSFSMRLVLIVYSTCGFQLLKCFCEAFHFCFPKANTFLGRFSSFLVLFFIT